jgi:hypothetical protein
MPTMPLQPESTRSLLLRRLQPNRPPQGTETMQSPSLALCIQYLAVLDAAAQSGSTMARDYRDVAVGEFRDRLEEMVLDVRKRERLEAQAAPKHTVSVVGALVAPLNWGDTSNGPVPAVVADSRWDTSRQGSLF